MPALTIPAFHVFYAPTDEVDAVGAWLDLHDAWDVLNAHEIRVDGQTLVYQAPAPGFTRNGRSYTRIRKLVAPPPPITSTPRPDLHDLFREHAAVEFPTLSTDFGCAACTTTFVFVPWLCPTVMAAIES